ncbi:MAG TPA: hypothetical protein VMF06_03130, partial [Candidatus Limnocylindria bacterium]|nr:hypothetical protein [Candidatus Limnocylindria bacterium]
MSTKPFNGRALPPSESSLGATLGALARRMARAIHPKLGLLAAGLLLTGLPVAQAQITNVVFFDDFEAASIDPAKLVPAAPVFEGGTGDIAATQAGGVVEFTGTVSQQWWAGATLKVVPTFQVSDEANVAVSVDRVLENGVGTSQRSALWIMDSTQNYYVLFAENKGENHWQYNRKINEAGDSPTGGGATITAFDAADGPYIDGGLHVMKAIANGKTVKLYLDDLLGAEVKFPFTNLVFHIGSYARANGDTADTTFDNLKVETIGAATFSTRSLTLTSGQTVNNITVKIPAGANATTPVQLRVVSSDPSAVLPVGAVGGTLTLTFPAGGSNTKDISVQALQVGGSQFTLQNDIGLAAGNALDVTVIPGPGIQLQDDFVGDTLDATKWVVNNAAFEVGVGTFTAGPADGSLTLGGTLDIDQYWGGISVKTVKSYTATKDLPLVVDVDRVSIDPLSSDGVTDSTAVRSGVFLTTGDRSKFLFFAENYTESGWEVNLNPGNPTGGGTSIAAFAAASDTGSHHIKLVSDGDTTEVFLDGVSGGRFAFPVSSGIFVELGAYTRALGDSVVAKFDKAKIENVLPCITVAPAGILAVAGQNTNTVTVTVPKLLNATANATVTVASSNPGVAVPAGGTGGSLTLTFLAGGASSQSFQVNALAAGTATFTLSNGLGACVDGSVDITVTPAPSVLLSDTFDTGFDALKWIIDARPLVDGTATAESGITSVDGVLNIAVVADVSNWPGLGLLSAQSFAAGPTTPLLFDIDRVKLDYVLVTGTGAKESAGVWVMDTNNGNYVFFSEYVTHDGTENGWRYNRSIGQAGDTPVTGAGVKIAAFEGPQYNEQGRHHVKVVVNGASVNLYLDGVFGATVPFPSTNGLVFGFANHVAAATDTV